MKALKLVHVDFLSSFLSVSHVAERFPVSQSNGELASRVS